MSEDRECRRGGGEEIMTDLDHEQSLSGLHTDVKAQCDGKRTGP